VHQHDDSQPVRLRDDDVGDAARHEPVDEHDGAIGHGGERAGE
jgi:hypothetical protein